MSTMNSPDQFIDKLYTLDPAAQPSWGGMSAQQMVEHLGITLMISNGKIKLPCPTPAEKLPALLAFLKSDSPLPRNFQPPGLTVLQPVKYSSIAEAADKVRKEALLFHKHFGQPGIAEVHPVFGELDYEQWKHFHKKHFIHHMTQFGLLG